MTTASYLLNELRAKGVRLSLNGERMRIEAPHGAIDERIKRHLAELKTDLIQLLQSAPDGEYFRHLYHERAAIFEFEGNLECAEAERRAYGEVFMEFVATHYPEIKATFEKIIHAPPLN